MADENVGVKLVIQDYELFISKIREAQSLANDLNGKRVVVHFASEGLDTLKKELQGLGALVSKANRGVLAAASGGGGAAGAASSGIQSAAAQARSATSSFDKLEAVQRRQLETTLRAAKASPAVISEQMLAQNLRFNQTRMDQETNLTDDLRKQYDLRKQAFYTAYQQEQQIASRVSQPAQPTQSPVSRNRLATLERDIKAQEGVVYRSQDQFQAKYDGFTTRLERASAGASQAEIDRVRSIQNEWQTLAQSGVVKSSIDAIEKDVSAAGIRVGRSYEVFESLRMAEADFARQRAQADTLPGATDVDRAAIAKLADRRAQIFAEEQTRAEKQIGNRIRSESFEKSFMGQLASAESRTYGARILASEMQRMGMSMVIGAVGVEMFAQKQAEKYLTEFRQPLGRVQRALDLTGPQKEYLDTTLLERAGKESMVSAVDSATAMRVWSEAINTVVGSEKDLYDATSQTGLVVQTELITNLVKLNEGTATVDQTVTDTAAILTQFGMVSSNAATQTANLTTVVSLLDTAAASGLANVNDIGSSMKFFAGRAHDLGVQLPEAVASIEMLAQVGLKGSQAGRGMDQLIKSMVAPTPKAQDAFAELLGTNWQNQLFDMADPKQPFRGLANFLQEMAKATEHMGVATRQEKMAALGDANAIRTLNALILRTIEARKMGVQMMGQEVDYLGTLTRLREQGSAGIERELAVLEAVAGIDFGDLSAVDSFQQRLVELRADISTEYSQSVIQLETAFLQLGKSLASTVVPAMEAVAGAMQKIADLIAKNPEIGEWVIKTGAIVGALGVATLASSAVIRAAVNWKTITMALSGSGGLGALLGSLTGKTAMGLGGASERQIAALVVQGVESGGVGISAAQQEAVGLAAKMSKAVLTKGEVLAVTAAAGASAAALTKKEIQAVLAREAAQVGGAGLAGAAVRVGTGAWVEQVGIKAAAVAALGGLAKAAFSLPVLLVGPIQKAITGLARENALQFIGQQKTEAGRTVATALRGPDLARLPAGASPLGPIAGVAQLQAAANAFIYKALNTLGIETVAGMQVPKGPPSPDQWKVWASENSKQADLLHQVLAKFQSAMGGLGSLPDKIGDTLSKVLVGPPGKAVLTRGEMAAEKLAGPSPTRSLQTLWALMPWADMGKYREKLSTLGSGLVGTPYEREYPVYRPPAPSTADEWKAVFAQQASEVFQAPPAPEDIDKAVKDLFEQATSAAAAMEQAGVPAGQIAQYLDQASAHMAALQSGSDTLASTMIGLVRESDRMSKNLAQSAAEMTALAALRAGAGGEWGAAAFKPVDLGAVDIQGVADSYIKQLSSMFDNLVKGGYDTALATDLYNQGIAAILQVPNDLLDSAGLQMLNAASVYGAWFDDPMIGAKASELPKIALSQVYSAYDQAIMGMLMAAAGVKFGEAGQAEINKKKDAATKAAVSLANAAMTPDQRSIKGLQDERDAALYGVAKDTPQYAKIQRDYASALSQVGTATKKATMGLEDVASKWRGLISSALDAAKGLSVTDTQWSQTLGMQGGPPEDQGDSNKSKMWGALSAAIGPYIDTAWEPLRRLASAAQDPNTQWAGMLPGGVGPGTPQAQAYFQFVQGRVEAFDPAYSQFFPDKTKIIEGIMGDLAGQSRKEKFITDVVAQGKTMGLDEATLRKYFEDPQAELDKTMGILDGSIAVSTSSTDNLKAATDISVASTDNNTASVDSNTAAVDALAAKMNGAPVTPPPDGTVPPTPPDPNAGKYGGEKFAKGGLVTRPTYALIGEAGPELIIPLGRSSGFTGKGFVAPTPIVMQTMAPQIGSLNLNTQISGGNPAQIARTVVSAQRSQARNLGLQILKLAAREGY